MEKSPLRRRITPSVPYTLSVENADGSTFEQSFKLSFDLNAITTFETVTGVSLLTNMGQILEQPSVATSTALFWVAILGNHPEWAGQEGLEILRSNITLDKLAGIRRACVDAFLTQLPKEKADAIRSKMAEAEKAAAEGTEIPLALAAEQEVPLKIADNQ